MVVLGGRFRLSQGFWDGLLSRVGGMLVGAVVAGCPRRPVGQCHGAVMAVRVGQPLQSPKEHIYYVPLDSVTEYVYISDLNTRLCVG